MIQRRGFLGAILAAGVAPAFVRSGVLMPVKEIWVPPPIVQPSGQFGYTGSNIWEMEIGRVEGFRFIESPVVQLGQRGFIKADLRPKSVNHNAHWMNALMKHHA